jgi:uncharacterized protein (TIGR03000 family)
MYSIVLAMALTGGGDVPAGLLNHGCCGGGGHHSSCYGGCYGSSYGCCGGGHKHHGHGCSGSCYGGCYGSSYGCCGGGHKHHHRSHGCCGGCYGGCYGSSYGYGGCYGGSTIGAPIVPAPVAPATPPVKKTSIDNAAPATLFVSVPADARLTIDGEATTSTTTQRVFVSPALNFGREYHYTLQAEFTKDGKVVKVSKEVAVKAGDETRVNFDAESVADVASR